MCQGNKVCLFIVACVTGLGHKASVKKTGKILRMRTTQTCRWQQSADGESTCSRLPMSSSVFEAQALRCMANSGDEPSWQRHQRAASRRA